MSLWEINSCSCLVFPLGIFIPSLELNFISQFKALISSLPTLSVESNLFPLLYHICTSVTYHSVYLLQTRLPHVWNILCKYPLSDLLLFFNTFNLWALCGQWPSLDTRAHAGWGLAYSGIGHLFISPRVLLAYQKLTISDFRFTSESTIAQNISAHSGVWYVVLKVFVFYWLKNIVFPHTKTPHLVEEN